MATKTIEELRAEAVKVRPTDIEMLDYYKKWLTTKKAEFKKARGARREAIGREIRRYERSIKDLETKELSTIPREEKRCTA